MRAQDLPDYKDMPAVKGMPHGTAWGLWDKNGERDNCGSLNLLTPENTIAAQKEIKSGTGVALKSAPAFLPQILQLPKFKLTPFIAGDSRKSTSQVSLAKNPYTHSRTSSPSDSSPLTT